MGSCGTRYLGPVCVTFTLEGPHEALLSYVDAEFALCPEKHSAIGNAAGFPTAL